MYLIYNLTMGGYSSSGSVAKTDYNKLSITMKKFLKTAYFSKTISTAKVYKTKDKAIEHLKECIELFPEDIIIIRQFKLTLTESYKLDANTKELINCSNISAYLYD